MAAKPMHILRNSANGLEVLSGVEQFKQSHQLTPKPVQKFELSPDGKLLALCRRQAVAVYSTVDYKLLHEFPEENTQHIKFSPMSTQLVTWHPFRSNVEDDKNLAIFDAVNNKTLAKLEMRKADRWEPHWSDDEKVVARHVNQELHFFEGQNYERYVTKFFTQKVASFSLSSSKANGTINIACYSEGTKGQPSFVRMYKYPAMDNPIANKSFYKVDRVNYLWSPKGDHVLLNCSSDVDKSGKSYYGEQSLQFMDSSGGSCGVHLSKAGPIHSASWTPTGLSQFIVIYGTIPAKASLFNIKCDVVFDFGEPAMVNTISFNPFGNLVALSGFGNLRGGVHVWDVEKKIKITHFDSPDTTDLSWSPDGIKILTATTAPRLRVGNGIKVMFAFS